MLDRSNTNGTCDDLSLNQAVRRTAADARHARELAGRILAEAVRLYRITQEGRGWPWRR